MTRAHITTYGHLLQRTLLLWVLFLPLAVMNGIVRETTYASSMGDLAAHQISTIIAIFAFLVLSDVILRPVAGKVTTKQLAVAGALLVTLTVLFEFGFGRVVDDKSWSLLLEDFNIFKGRIWGLFLLTEFVAPFSARVPVTPPGLLTNRKG